MLLECLWSKFSQVLASEGNIVAARPWSEHFYLSEWSRGHRLENRTQMYPDWQHAGLKYPYHKLFEAPCAACIAYWNNSAAKNSWIWSLYLSQPWKPACSVVLPVRLTREEISCLSLRLGYVHNMRNVGSRQARISLRIKEEWCFQKLFHWYRGRLKHVVADVTAYNNNRGT